MRLSSRRFRDRIIGRREMPGHWSETDEWAAGAIEEIELRASVQPIRLDDSDTEGGAQLRHVARVFVLPVRERIGFARAVLLWNGDPITLGGDPLTIGRGAETIDRHALAAAREQAGADRVVVDGAVFVVRDSATWPRFTVATLLRES